MLELGSLGDKCIHLDRFKEPCLHAKALGFDFHIYYLPQHLAKQRDGILIENGIYPSRTMHFMTTTAKPSRNLSSKCKIRSLGFAFQRLLPKLTNNGMSFCSVQCTINGNTHFVQGFIYCLAIWPFSSKHQFSQHSVDSSHQNYKAQHYLCHTGDDTKLLRVQS